MAGGDPLSVLKNRIVVPWVNLTGLRLPVLGWGVGPATPRLADTPGRHLWDQTQGLVAL